MSKFGAAFGTAAWPKLRFKNSSFSIAHARRGSADAVQQIGDAAITNARGSVRKWRGEGTTAYTHTRTRTHPRKHALAKPRTQQHDRTNSHPTRYTHPRKHTYKHVHKQTNAKTTRCAQAHKHPDKRHSLTIAPQTNPRPNT